MSQFYYPTQVPPTYIVAEEVSPVYVQQAAGSLYGAAKAKKQDAMSDFIINILVTLAFWLIMLFIFSFLILALWNGVMPRLFPGVRPMTLSLAIGFAFLAFFVGGIFNNGKLFGLDLRGPWYGKGAKSQ